MVFLGVSQENAGGCGTTLPISAPGGDIKTAVQFVRYFESQGISPNGAAGITGNLHQENGFSPATNAGGNGIAQWSNSWFAQLIAYVAPLGLDSHSVAGQLVYLVYDLRTSYASLLTQLNNAPDPATAATMFETSYEICSGVTGFMQVTPGSLCNDVARRTYALSAAQASVGGPGVVPIGLTTGGTCVAVGGSGGDPIPGFTPSRDDMGVDACAKPGMPIYAPAASTLVDVIGNWFTGDSGGPQPLLLFQFNPPLAGTYQNDQYWYVAEQILPFSTTKGTQFATGQPVATYNQAGTCIEIGWGSTTTSSRTLVPTDANPARGALTPEAEAFKVFFHIPWVGSSP